MVDRDHEEQLATIEDLHRSRALLLTIGTILAEECCCGEIPVHPEQHPDYQFAQADLEITQARMRKLSSQIQ